MHINSMSWTESRKFTIYHSTSVYLLASLTLEANEYAIQHKPGKDLANADALSRDICWVMQHLDTTPVTAADIKIWIDKDPLLSRLEDLF